MMDMMEMMDDQDGMVGMSFFFSRLSLTPVGLARICLSSVALAIDASGRELLL